MSTLTPPQFEVQTFSVLIEQSGTPKKQNRNQRLDFEMQAAKLLQNHPHFHGRCQSLKFQFADNCLTLRGWLPSFYLKQLAQEAVRTIAGIEVVNEIVVLSSVGELEFSDSTNNHHSLDKLAQQKPK